MIDKYNVTNFKKESSFYFDVTKIYSCIKDLSEYSELNPSYLKFIYLILFVIKRE